MARSTGLHVDGAAIDGERGFLDRLVQRRMSWQVRAISSEDAPKAIAVAHSWMIVPASWPMM